MHPDLRSVSRRGFVAGGVAISGLANAPLRALTECAHASVAGPATHDRPFRVVVDRMLPAAATFEAVTAAGGHDLLPISNDPGHAWMRVLEPRLRESPIVLTGMTTGATLFCLEYLGRDYGLKTAYRFDGGPHPGNEWIGQAALLATLPVPADAIRPGFEVLVDLSGSLARSVFAWMLVPR